MIISASYKTDIPAFYGRWFLNRLQAGYCKAINPYGRQVTTVPLTRDAVDGFVFWTRNAGPFFDALGEVSARGFAFAVQFTITGYPRPIEASVIDRRRAVQQMRELARRFGPEVAVWRYDPVVATSLTTPAWHVENFRTIARSLAGVTNEVVISFAHLYAKTRRNMDAAARAFDFTWSDPDADWKGALAGKLAAIAQYFGMQLTVCSQPEFAAASCAEARCIDAERLSRIAGYPIPAKVKGNRVGCACFESRDIGDYDSCVQGCAYCYAVRNAAAARARLAAHDPDSEFLIGPAREAMPAERMRFRPSY